MTTKTGGNLKLQLFAEGTVGWGNAINENTKLTDQKMTLLTARAKNRTTDIEKSVAAHSAEILALIQEKGANFTIKAEALKAAIVLELKDYIDSLINTHTARALANQEAAQAVVATLRTEIAALDDLINSHFNTLENTINNRFSTLSTDLQTKYASVQTMRDQLLTILTAIANKLDLHIQDRENPHRIDFDQTGGSAALTYIANEEKDKRYI